MFKKIMIWFRNFFTARDPEPAKVKPQPDLDCYGQAEGVGYSDDVNSLIKMTEGDSCLNLQYCHGWQFVQSELPKYELRDNNSRKVFLLGHKPVFAGTTTGTVYVHDQPVYTFVVDSNNNFTFSQIGDPDFKISEGHLCLNSGELTINFEDNALPNHHVVVSYEYNAEAQRD